MLRKLEKSEENLRLFETFYPVTKWFNDVAHCVAHIIWLKYSKLSFLEPIVVPSMVSNVWCGRSPLVLFGGIFCFLVCVKEYESWCAG